MTSAAGPSSVKSNGSVSLPPTRTSSAPPEDRIVTGLAAITRLTAAHATAHADVPDAAVSPAPRSQIRMNNDCLPVGTANWMLHRFGKIR